MSDSSKLEDVRLTPAEALLQFFDYRHLPDPAREASRAFATLAFTMCRRTNPSAEQTAALRNLLVSKDAAVRSVIAERRTPAEVRAMLNELEDELLSGGD